MKLLKETSYKIQIRHNTAGWVFVKNGDYHVQVGNISAAKKEKRNAESFYQCKARIIKVTHREEVFNAKAKSWQK